MTEHFASKKPIRYVAPPQEEIDKIVQAVCAQLATTDKRFSPPEIAHGFSVFLGVIARIQADRLNKSPSSDDAEVLDTNK